MSAVARRYFVRGRNYLRKGEFDDAQREFAAALELSPGFVEARLGYAHIVVRNDAQRAAQSLRVGLTRTTRPTERRQLLAALGDALVCTGDLGGAREAFNEAVQLPGGEVGLHDRLSRLYAKTGQFAEALRHLAVAAAEK